MNDFTYQGICRLLADLHASHGLFPLCDWMGQPGIILRHDVDLDIQPAYELSRREMEMGVRGSYFFLVTADTYNCQSRANRAMLRAMSDDGFEIGLHFDPSIYEAVEPEALGAHARDEAQQLEDITGRRINSVSLHNPSVANEYPMLPGWLNAYDERIFDPKIYLSDSRMRCRADPSSFFSGASDRTHQFLLHPMHYADEPPVYPRAKLAYIRRLVATIDANFKPNTTYAELVGDRLIPMLREDMKDWR